MVTIHSRTSWGARRPDGNKTLYGLADEVFLHHSVTTHLAADATAEQERAQMRAIEAIGYNRFGPTIGISYNVIIFPSGRAYQGVSWNRRGAHTDGRNSTVRSICFAGNYEANEPTRAQIDTAAAIYAEGRGKWWRSDAPVRGHRDIKPTACPGKNVYKYRAAIQAGAISGGGTSAPAPKPKPAQSSGPAKLDVDGKWGSGTTLRLQQVLGAPFKDGKVSRQSSTWRKSNPGLTTGWEWDGSAGDGGSQTIRLLQKRLGVTQDGKVGPQTIKALQRHLGTHADGEVWNPSSAVKALQRRLNEGKL
jgi:hypothetical protein